MKAWITLAAVLFVPVCSYAQAAKPCEELKSEIATKLDAKGVKSYSLEIAPKEQDVEGKGGRYWEGRKKKNGDQQNTTPATKPREGSRQALTGEFRSRTQK